MRRGPEVTALVNTQTPGFFTIRNQAQTVMGKTLVVNFDKEMLLAAVMRSDSALLPSIKITRVREFADRIVATVKQTVSQRIHAVRARMIIKRLDVVAVPQSDKPVFFVVSNYTGDSLARTITYFPVLHEFTGDDSKVHQPTTRVIRDPQAWTALWTASIGSPSPARKIDFTRQMAVAIFRGNAGETNANTLSYSEGEISDDGKILTVSYTLLATPFGKEEINPSPYLVLVIPSSKLPVTFHGDFIAAP